MASDSSIISLAIRATIALLLTMLINGRLRKNLTLTLFSMYLTGSASNWGSWQRVMTGGISVVTRTFVFSRIRNRGQARLVRTLVLTG